MVYNVALQCCGLLGLKTSVKPPLRLETPLRDNLYKTDIPMALGSNNNETGMDWFDLWAERRSSPCFSKVLKFSGSRVSHAPDAWETNRFLETKTFVTGCEAQGFGLLHVSKSRFHRCSNPKDVGISVL